MRSVLVNSNLCVSYIPNSMFHSRSNQSSGSRMEDWTLTTATCATPHQVILSTVVFTMAGISVNERLYTTTIRSVTGLMKVWDTGHT
jgi:hypothetical protein